MKFIRFYLTAFFLIVTSVSYSQVSTKQIQEIFSQAAPFTWAMPVPNSSPIPLEWHERSTSMASEGIRSFVGYYQNQLVATLSISGLNVSGTYSYGTISYEITSIKKKLLFIKEEEGKCDTKDTHLEDLPMLQKVSSITQRDANTPKIENTNVLRVYRLAMTITNSTYTHSIINKDINKVYTFWANTELFLNEVYTRDIGVRFEVVKDDRLIITDPSKDNFTKRNAYYAVDNHTQYLNETIGETSYDVGICVSFSTSAGLRGLAYVNAAYTTLKAGAFARPIKETIAHELGHMFGAIHTFSGPTSDPSSDKTEYYTGTSVMSYGTPRNFFSLSSIETIRKILAGIPYYTDKERTNVVGDSSFANIPFGIPLNSQPPRIDDSQIQPEYIIPENTFFQFYVSATDPDSNTLYYTANQHDPRKGSSYSITQYMIYKPSTKNPVTFQREYRKETGTIEHNSWLSTQNTGTFTFWISANDSQPNSAHNYITQYDLMETKVTIKEGIPFALERLKKKAYKGGEKVQLTWKVDKTIFDEHSKVRILLSEDFGETFPYILSESTENDGSQEVTLPNIQIGKKRFGASPINAPAGVIKVEVIQGLAFALTDYNPNNGGGFTIEKDYNIKDELAFVTTPKSITLQCKELIPEVVFPTFQGGCNPKITYKDQLIDKKCENQYTIERTFTLSDECNQSLTYTQYIKIEDNTPPTFVGTLPKDISVSSNQIPQQGEVSATDNCNGAVTIQKLREEVKDANQNITKVIYKWIASDICGNESIYTQSIQIDKKPLKWENLPKNYTLNCWNTTTNTQSEDFTTKKYLLTKNSEDFINKKYPLTKNSED
ncbi:MAG: zinc-dependent metalloprotease family protein, partial [Capnocytophaga sp.]|nr:zinc-dependent metalloprotease family protein [Capnocytophaga sp.]